MTTLLLMLLAFAFGSFPSGVMVSRRFRIDDIRQHGSGNIGASNVAYVAGARAGFMVGAMDIIKGIIPVVIGLVLRLPHADLAFVGLAAVLGHDFSIALHFRGGKGVATTFGVALVLAPYAAGVAAITWIASLLISKFASLASLVALGLLPMYMLLTRRPEEYVLLAAGLFVLSAAKHHENIGNLRHDDTRALEKSL
jgi:acyl phosphate:glycerol-3-phosphate acyltransferase